MTFDKFMQWYKKQGGTQKGFGLDMGISEAQMSRIAHRKQRVGLKMLNRMVAAGSGKMSMGELCKEFRPDLYKMFRGGDKMADIAQCARCGEKAELCNSIRIDGIKQPRFCKPCVLTGPEAESVNNIYWIKQMDQLDDKESLKLINGGDDSIGDGVLIINV